MKNIDTLEKLGLSPGGAKVYRALLSLEVSSVGPICKLSGVSRSKIYEILEKLIAKGLANTIISGGKTLYRASGPNTLNDILEQKRKDLVEEEKEVQKLIPELLSLKTPQKRAVEMYEGITGLKAVREELLSEMKKGDTILVMGAPKLANIKWERWFLDFHKRREKTRVGLRILYNSDARAYGKKRTKFKLTKVKYMPENFITPTWFDVFNEKVLIVIIPSNGKPYAILVRDKSVSDSVKLYFETLWKIGIK